MDLLARYLWAVGRYLPEETKADTVAELRANLLEQMDGRAEELGRPLADADVAAMLKAHGRPEAVALRYLPQRSLIGPTIFPFYVFTLRRAFPLFLLVYLVAEGASLMKHGAVGFAEGLGVLLLELVPSALTFLAMVTLVFAGIEWARSRELLGAGWREWDPAQMPEVPKEKQGAKAKSFAKRVVELVVHIVWMGWVLSIPWRPVWHVGAGVIGIDMEGFGIDFGPVWHGFYVLLVVMLCVQLVMKVIALRDGNRAWVKPMEIATDLLGVVALGMLAFGSEYFVPLSAASDVHSVAEVNHWIGIAMRIAVVFAVFGVAQKCWKYGKRRVPGQRLAF